MPERMRKMLAWGLAVACIATTAYHLLLLARVIAVRYRCPLDLELLESAHVYHAFRVSRGLGLYGDPARGFATFPYPPLYWVAIEAVAALVGFNNQAGRLVSIVALLGTLAVLGWLVARRAPDRRLGIAMAMLATAGICAGYPFCGGSYDLSRPDMMNMFLVVLAGAMASDGPISPARTWATGAILAASIYTKQTGVPFAAWLVAHALWRDRRGGAHLAAATVLCCAVPFVALEAHTSGWFGRWVSYPGRQSLFPERTCHALELLLRQAPFLPLLLPLWWWLRKRGAVRPTTTLWTGMLLAGITSSVLAGIKDLAWLNVWMPGVLLAWPVGFLLFQDALATAWPRGKGQEAAWATLACGCCLLGLQAYDPRPFMPTTDRWEAARQLEAVVRSLRGGVVVTTAPMVAVDAGNTNEQPILMTYEDARRGGMKIDYVDALVASGARWILTTGRYSGDRAPEPRMARAFVRERELDFNVHSLAEWDRPTNVVLWRRIDPPPLAQ